MTAWEALSYGSKPYSVSTKFRRKKEGLVGGALSYPYSVSTKFRRKEEGLVGGDIVLWIKTLLCKYKVQEKEGGVSGWRHCLMNQNLLCMHIVQDKKRGGIWHKQYSFSIAYIFFVPHPIRLVLVSKYCSLKELSNGLLSFDLGASM